MADAREVHVQQHGGGWVLAGPGAEGFGMVNDYLGYLADRRYSPRTIRAYAFDLLHFVRWLLGQRLRLEQVTTEVLLGYLGACRVQTLPGRPGRRGDNVFLIRDGRNTGLAPATINRRLTAISGLFAYWEAHLDGVPQLLRRQLVAYLECCVGTRTRSTVSHMASRLAHFGRFLAGLDPGLESLGDLDRQRHIEPWPHHRPGPPPPPRHPAERLGAAQPHPHRRPHAGRPG